SNAEIYDPTNDTFFIRNLDVQPSFINNFDIRYENFSGSGDMIAISTFYKNAEDPIEIVTYAPYAPDNFIARNVETVDIFGAELEIRKRISQNFKVRFNGSLINSRMRMGDVEFESRKNNARDGETIDRYRDLQGQSPYLINTAVEYQTADNNLFGSLFYNVQGKTLQVVGVSNVPDIYTMPFNSLNMRVEKKFGVDRKTALSLKINNILNDTRRSEFVSYGIQSDYFFSRLEEGITFSLGFSRRF
ncbi:MAG TPA: TonB-dependent receptor, partial [Flavobacteriaceae bacterium]|nr:TonB-dependent receptor [Flavobacteriaceae bacterium]